MVIDGAIRFNLSLKWMALDCNVMTLSMLAFNRMVIDGDVMTSTFKWIVIDGESCYILSSKCDSF